jgi:hypothetical protein
VSLRFLADIVSLLLVFLIFILIGHLPHPPKINETIGIFGLAVLWAVLCLAVQKILMMLKPLSLVEKTGTIFFRQDRQGRYSRKVVYKKPNPFDKLTVADLLGKKNDFPVQMEFSLQSDVDFSATVLQVQGLKIVFRDSPNYSIAELSLVLLKKNKNKQALLSAMEDKIETALNDTLIEGMVQNEGQMTMNLNLKERFIAKLKAALEKEAYRLSDDYFVLLQNKVF